MRIIGIGVDIVETSRIAGMIERHGERFLQRVFTEEERAYCGGQKFAERCYAARFAAKEAVSKAFGTGIGEKIGWLDVTVQRNFEGKPSIRLEGAGKDFAAVLGIAEIMISLSHSDHYAVAQVVACGQ